MSQGLILYNGALLLVNGGLTVDPNCCCDPPPPPCLPCCVRIDWGTFDSDGNLYKKIPVNEFDELTIAIILPRPNDRIICNLDVITIHFIITGPDNPQMIGGRARYGRAWEHVYHSPPVSATGRNYPYCLTDWGSESTEASYQIELEFNECFLDEPSFLGYIHIQTQTPTGFWEEIDISRCTTPSWCCLVEIPCEDCCAVIINASAVIGLETWIVRDEVDPNDGHYTTIIKATPAGNNPVCNFIELEIFFIPPFHTVGATHRVTLDHDRTWVIGGIAPPLAGDGVQTDLRTDWGTITETELTAGLTNECWAVPGSPTCEVLLQYPDLVLFSSAFPIASVDFEECEIDVEECCNVVRCCPEPLPFLIHATFYNFNNCPCGDLTVIPMEWRSGQSAWVGTGEFCGTQTTLKLEVECEPGEDGEPFDIQFLLSVNSACVSIDRHLAAGQCTPIFQTDSFFVDGIFNDCCDGLDTRVNIITRGKIAGNCNDT